MSDTPPAPPDHPTATAVVVQMPPLPAGKLEQAGKVAGWFANLGAQGVNNLILAAAVAGVALLIYFDRNDRKELAASQQRYYESRDELHRQSLQTLTVTVQSFGTEVSALRQAVTNFERTIARFENRKPPGPEDEELVPVVAPAPKLKVP